MKKFVKIWSVLLTILIVSQASAQETITLKLRDETGETLAGATIKVVNGTGEKNVVSMTDVDGTASISITSFPAQLEISNVGYRAFTKTIKEKPSTILNVSMDKDYTGLNEVIVTGVGRPTKLDEAVSVYKIITAQDIRAQGAVNLQDALRNQLGLNVGQDAMLGGTIRMQGMSGDNVKILVDGLPLNGREGGNLDLSTVNMANIERIEIVQGPMSIMYGADALGGVINLITKNNKDDWRVGGDAFYESIGKYNFGVNGAYQKNKSNISLGLGRNFFQGWDPNFDTLRNPLWRPKEQYFANLKYAYKLSDNASLTYGMDYMNDQLFIKDGLDEFSVFHPDANDEKITTQRFTNRLQLKWKTGESGYWESNNSYSLYHRLRESYLTNLTNMEQRPDNSSGGNSTTIFNDINSRSTYNNKVGILNYTFGYDINLQFASGVEKIVGSKQNVGDYALFLITDINVTDNLKFQPALRASYNSKYEAPILPSFSILYKPSVAWRIRGSYARGFRAPTLKELYLDFKDSNHDVFGNPDLKAEDGHHVQVSTAYSVAKKGNNFCNVSLTSFFNDVTDMIGLYQVEEGIPGTPPPYSYINVGKFRNLNFQLQSESQWNSLKVVMGASYNNNLKTKFSEAFDYWEITGNLRYDLPVLFAGINLFYKYTSNMPMQTTDATGSLIVSESTVKDYHNIDFSIDKSFWHKRVNLTVGARNIFNNTILGVNSNNGGSGGSTGGHSGNTGGGMNLTTGRSYFATLSFQLSK